MGGNSILRITKTSKNDLSGILTHKLDTNKIDFIPIEEDSSLNFELSGWSEYENNFRRILYESGKFPKMGLEQKHLDYAFESFKRAISESMAVANFKENQQINTKRQLNNSTRSSTYERSPFDKR